jgi:hypothetical protein
MGSAAGQTAGGPEPGAGIAAAGVHGHNLVVGYGPGGGYDLSGRWTERHPHLVEVSARGEFAPIGALDDYGANSSPTVTGTTAISRSK